MRRFKISIITKLTILALLLIFQSCILSKQNKSNSYSSIENNPMIVFLNCSIIYDSIRQEHKIRLINKIITEGKIKDTTINSKKYENGDFEYSVLSKNNQVISHTYMPNPLDKTIEYVDESGRLGQKNIRLDSTQFSLRIPLIPNARYICFEKHSKRIISIDLLK